MGSIWEVETLQKAALFNHWPNPVKALVKKFEITACEDTLQFRIEYWAAGAFVWLFDNFFPGPREIERKFLTGSYKCGFYFFGKRGSVLNLVFEDKSIGVVVGEILGPVAQALWYVWAFETAFSALSTYSSMHYAIEKCGADRYECLMRDADAPLPPGIHTGGPVFSQIIWDPNHWGVTADNTVIIPERKNVHAFACGYLLANNHVVNSARVAFTIGTEEVAFTELGHMGSGEIKGWQLDWSDAHDAGSIKVQITYDIDAGGVINSDIQCTRFTVRETPLDIPNGGHSPKETPPPSSVLPCDFLTRFYDSM